MSLDLDIRPDVADGGTQDPEHIYCCCSPEIALCGAKIDTEKDCGHEECSHDFCERCNALLEEICILCGYGFDGPCFCGECP